MHETYEWVDNPEGHCVPQGCQRLRELIGEEVGARKQDAVIQVISEMNVPLGEASLNEEHKATILDDIMEGVGAQKKELLQKLVACLYPSRGEKKKIFLLSYIVHFLGGFCSALSCY
jgi:hypothetical protein